MNATRNSLICMTLLLNSVFLWAQVEEMSNTEMTEAYIQDGAIIIKQRIKSTPVSKQSTRVKVNVGPGEPAISEAEQVLEQNQQNTHHSENFDRDFADQATTTQFKQFENNQTTNSFTAPNFQSNAALSQQLRAQDLVRTGLGLPEGTEITQNLMVQYLTSFSGQSSGSPLGVTQSISNDGFHFSTPNPGGQIQSGIYPSGDNSMNIEVNNQQLLWNLLFPKQ